MCFEPQDLKAEVTVKLIDPDEELATIVTPSTAAPAAATTPVDSVVMTRRRSQVVATSPRGAAHRSPVGRNK